VGAKSSATQFWHKEGQFGRPGSQETQGHQHILSRSCEEGWFCVVRYGYFLPYRYTWSSGKVQLSLLILLVNIHLFSIWGPLWLKVLWILLYLYFAAHKHLFLLGIYPRVKFLYPRVYNFRGYGQLSKCIPIIHGGSPLCSTYSSKLNVTGRHFNVSHLVWV
jgi:hypothetical protein